MAKENKAYKRLLEEKDRLIFANLRQAQRIRELISERDIACKQLEELGEEFNCMARELNEIRRRINVNS